MSPTAYWVRILQQPATSVSVPIVYPDGAVHEEVVRVAARTVYEVGRGESTFGSFESGEQAQQCVARWIAEATAKAGGPS